MHDFSLCVVGVVSNTGLIYLPIKVYNLKKKTEASVRNI